MLVFLPIPLVLLLANLVHGAPVAVSDRRCVGGAEACSRSINCYATGLCGPALAKKSGLAHVFRGLKYARQDDDFDDSDSTDSDFDSDDLDSGNDDFADSSDHSIGSDFDFGDSDTSDSQADDSSDSTDLEGDDTTQTDDTSDQSADGSDQDENDDDSGLDGADDSQDAGDVSSTDADGDSTSADPDSTSTAADAGITDAPGSDSTDDGEDQSTTDGDDSASTTSDSAAAPDSTSTAADATSTDDGSISSDSTAAATSTSAADQPAASDSSDSLTCGAPGPNAATISLIKQFEGFVPSPAPDPIGLPTVGFGHKCTSKGCAEVTNAGFSFPLSQNTASQLLNNDVQQFVSCVNSAVSNSVTLTDNQVGALTAFSFNLGCGALKSSTLLKRLNNGEDPNTVAAAEIPRFNKAGGKVLAGLTRRRAAEVALFQTPSQVKGHPC